MYFKFLLLGLYITVCRQTLLGKEDGQVTFFLKH